MAEGGTARGGTSGQKTLKNLLEKIKAPHHIRQQLGGLFFLLLILFSRPSSTPAERKWIVPLGACVFALGTAGRAWASGFLVKNDALTTTGPYGRVRNPIYVSNLLVGVALVLLNGCYWTSVFLILLYLVCYVPGMRVEEENLRRRYGLAFESYARQVPLIVPHLSSVSGYGGDVWKMRAYLENREGFVSVGLLMGLTIVLWRRIFL